MGNYKKVSFPNKIFAAYKYYAPIALITLAGVGLSLVVFAGLRNLERSETETAFQLAVSERVSAVKKDIETSIVILESMFRLYKVAEDMAQQGFYEFTKPLLSHMHGVQSLGWLPRVRDSQRAEFEASIRQRGIAGFQITERGPERTMVRASQRDEYFPASDAGREEVDDSSVGFDVASDLTRGAALYRARDTGEISATARVTLVQESENQFGFLVFLPVYRKGMPADTVEDRRKNLQGFILGVFRIPDIVEEALSHLQPKGIDLLISDESAPEGERILYFHPSRTRVEPFEWVDESLADDSGVLQHTTRFEVGQRQWVILAMATPGFAALHMTWEPLYGLIVGLLFTGLVVTYVAVSTHRTAVIAKTNEKLEREIAERKQATGWLRFTEFALDHSSDPGFWIEPDGKFFYVNEAACHRLGYTRDELLTMTVSDIDPDFPIEIWPKHWEEMRQRKIFAFEAHHRTKTGETFPVEITTNHLVYEGKEYNCIFARDITKSKKAEQQLQFYAKRLVEVEESERHRLSRELHDRVGQKLAVLGINLNIMRKQLSDPSLTKIESTLQNSQQLVEETVERIRDVMSELRPPVLDECGLWAALHWYGKQFSQRTDLSVVFEGEEPKRRLSPAAEIALFRIVQEALTNVAKHARARHVTLELQSRDGALSLSIADDGTGFDSTLLECSEKQTGWGMMTMRERVQAVGGKFRVETRPGQGTRVLVEMKG